MNTLARSELHTVIPYVWANTSWQRQIAQWQSRRACHDVTGSWPRGVWDPIMLAAQAVRAGQENEENLEVLYQWYRDHEKDWK